MGANASTAPSTYALRPCFCQPLNQPWHFKQGYRQVGAWGCWITPKCLSIEDLCTVVFFIVSYCFQKSVLKHPQMFICVLTCLKYLKLHPQMFILCIVSTCLKKHPKRLICCLLLFWLASKISGNAPPDLPKYARCWLSARKAAKQPNDT